jgi:adenylate kinase
VCGGTAVRRPDDTPDAIDRRLAQYEEEAGPLLAMFEDLGLLVTVDSVGHPAEVFERVMRSLQPVLWGTGEAVG